jgi:hypothetical protein
VAAGEEEHDDPEEEPGPAGQVQPQQPAGGVLKDDKEAQEENHGVSG